MCDRAEFFGKNPRWAKMTENGPKTKVGKNGPKTWFLDVLRKSRH